MIEGHGDDLYRYGDRISANFSSNICQHADYTALNTYLRAHLDAISHYPEPQPVSVERLLAQNLNMPEDCIMVTCGVTEAIYMIAQMTQGSVSLIPQPTFSEYADACQLYHHRIVTAETDTETCCYWLCNPNNPTGRVSTGEIIRRLETTDSSHYFIVDQSYEDYTLCPVLDAQRVLTHPNLILLHSLSKRFAVPGLRIGYVVAHSSVIGRLKAYRRPWSVSALALEAARFLLDEHPAMLPPLDRRLEEATRLRKALNNLDGISIGDTDTTFMLGHTDKGTAAQLKDYLVCEHGMLIRDGSNFAGLSPRHFRLASQGAEENDRLVKAIRQWLEDQA